MTRGGSKTTTIDTDFRRAKRKGAFPRDPAWNEPSYMKNVIQSDGLDVDLAKLNPIYPVHSAIEKLNCVREISIIP